MVICHSFLFKFGKVNSFLDYNTQNLNNSYCTKSSFINVKNFIFEHPVGHNVSCTVYPSLKSQKQKQMVSS
jgi:hypothetical protein